MVGHVVVVLGQVLGVLCHLDLNIPYHRLPFLLNVVRVNLILLALETICLNHSLDIGLVGVLDRGNSYFARNGSALSLQLLDLLLGFDHVLWRPRFLCSFGSLLLLGRQLLATIGSFRTDGRSFNWLS